MEHAVVIGASVAGLLSAAALRRSFDRVTVLDRDILPAVDTHRKGAAQSRHAHGLLARGRAAMDELLPGLTDELVAQGALTGDLQTRGRWIYGGHRLARGDSGMTGLCASRPLLEGQIRRRVTALPGVRVVAERPVYGLLAAGSRVTGVRLAGDEPMPADLVVDASGRGSRMPFWLGELGYPPPVEEQVTIDLMYGTREFRREPSDAGGDLVIVVAPTAQVPRGGVALAAEGDRWVVSLAGYGGVAPDLPLSRFAAFAGSLAAPDLHDLVTSVRPIGEPRTFRTPACVRRRYERLTDFPDGLLAVGDAVCALSPYYGQGMTVAALEAESLLDRDLRPQPFFERTARLLDAPWEIVVGGDLRMPGVQGTLTPRGRLVSTYLDRFYAAAADDPDLSMRFLRVANLLDPPSALMSPWPLFKVLRSGAPRAVPVPA